MGESESEMDDGEADTATELLAELKTAMGVEEFADKTARAALIEGLQKEAVWRAIGFAEATDYGPCTKEQNAQPKAYCDPLVQFSVDLKGEEYTAENLKQII